MTTFTESEVEDATLEWLESLGWEVAHGPRVAPHSAGSERTVYTEVILDQRLRQTLDRLNPPRRPERRLPQADPPRRLHPGSP